MSCGCGRSPTGECIGWHDLTEEEYQVALEEYNSQIMMLKTRILLGNQIIRVWLTGLI